jgi:hypothetical protein
MCFTTKRKKQKFQCSMKKKKKKTRFLILLLFCFYLETRSQSTIESADVSFVSCTDVIRGVLENDIGNLKSFQGQRRSFVVVYRLQHSNQQRRSRNLKLDCLWICKRHRRRIVFSIQEIEIFLPRALSKRKREKKKKLSKK